MNFQLDPAILMEMTQQARQCFLDEDAPEYLQALEKGLQQRNGSVDFKSMLRAAHSLKGGAGLAQLPSIRELAHKLEDLLEAIEQNQVPDLESAWLLFEKGVVEISFLLTQARTFSDVVADANLLQALEELGQFQKTEVEATETDTAPNALVKTALTQDLEACLVTIEEIPEDAPIGMVIESLTIFFEECLLLGETLDLPWLVDRIELLEAILEESSPDEALLATKQAIGQLREERDRYLDSTLTPEAIPTPSDEIEEEKISSDRTTQDESLVQQQPGISQLRVPLKLLEEMNNKVEELIFTQERLQLQQQLLNQSNKRLRQLALQFEPLRKEVQNFYDRLAIAPLKSSIPLNVRFTGDSASGQFDSLELDSFTDLHSSLQTFQELMLQVQETREDLDLINRELSEDLEDSQKNLKTLHKNFTKSRLVSFQILAQRFVPQIQNLNRKYDKLVNLEIEADNLLLDQLLLEQLQTPLTHLLNNAFDHGIESKSERLANNKPETARIILKARAKNNQLVISLADDGCGINLQRVYQRAIDRGLCPRERSFEELRKEEIINYIFQPNFSTAEKVSELSGRGVGLDIVRSQIQKLRGTIQVETEAAKGTIFTVKLPLSLSLLSLLLFQWQNRLLAVPTSSVLETVLYSELDWLETNPPSVRWHQKVVPVLDLWKLLPYSTKVTQLAKPMVGIILDGSSGPFMVTVDALLSERQLIVKPFDDTLITPPYLAGCTILGTGEAVPVILPQAFELSSIQTESQQRSPQVTTPSSDVPTVMVVEDSVATRRLLEKIFKQIGFNVVVCRDGQEALEEIYQHGKLVDLVISDVEMPRINGFELLEKLRSDPAWEKVPVVMATSRTGERHRQRAKALGVNAYLAKPIQPQQLLATIEPLLNF